MNFGRLDRVKGNEVVILLQVVEFFVSWRKVLFTDELDIRALGGRGTFGRRVGVFRITMK